MVKITIQLDLDPDSFTEAELPALLLHEAVRLLLSTGLENVDFKTQAAGLHFGEFESAEVDGGHHFLSVEWMSDD